MQFCDRCGSVMMTEDAVMVCTAEDCDETVDRDEDRAAAFVSTESQSDATVIETEEGAAFEGKPTAEVDCDTCGHDRAWYTIKQTAAADEAPTRFFKCMECGSRWRDYN